MPVTWSDFEERRGATFTYLQLADFIAARIQAGDLQSGDQLPSHRALADLTGHAPETIKLAYRALRERGLVESSVRGTFVKG